MGQNRWIAEYKKILEDFKADTESMSEPSQSAAQFYLLEQMSNQHDGVLIIGKVSDDSPKPCDIEYEGMTYQGDEYGYDRLTEFATVDGCMYYLERTSVPDFEDSFPECVWLDDSLSPEEVMEFKDKLEHDGFSGVISVAEFSSELDSKSTDEIEYRPRSISLEYRRGASPERDAFVDDMLDHIRVPKGWEKSDLGISSTEYVSFTDGTSVRDDFLRDVSDYLKANNSDDYWYVDVDSFALDSTYLNRNHCIVSSDAFWVDGDSYRGRFSDIIYDGGPRSEEHCEGVNRAAERFVQKVAELNSLAEENGLCTEQVDSEAGLDFE